MWSMELTVLPTGRTQTAQNDRYRNSVLPRFTYFDHWLMGCHYVPTTCALRESKNMSTILPLRRS